MLRTYLVYNTVVVLCQFFLVLAENSFWYIHSPYSCGVVLVFLVLAGNSFWCYVRTQCTIQLCGCVIFVVVAGKFYYDRKKKFKSSVWRVVLLCQFLVLAGNRFCFLVLAGNSFWCYVRT